MKILILAIYYNRPLLLAKAMQSLLEASKHYNNWEMVFGDDNSPHPGEPIVRNVFKECENKITFVNSKMSLDDKLEKGICIGKYANDVIEQSDADIAITLCDDDRLVTTYLKDIVEFFKKNPQEMWAYSHISLFNPIKEEPNLTLNKQSVYNVCTHPMSPANKLDASQIAFRLQAFREGIAFPESTAIDKKVPWVGNIDAMFFEQMMAKYGPAKFTGLMAQHKGIHDYQLVWNKKKTKYGIIDYIKTVNEAAGKIL